MRARERNARSDGANVIYAGPPWRRLDALDQLRYLPLECVDGKSPQFVILNHAGLDSGIPAFAGMNGVFCAVGDLAALALSGAEPVETLLLLVAERAVKLLERGLHGLHRA